VATSFSTVSKKRAGVWTFLDSQQKERGRAVDILRIYTQNQKEAPSLERSSKSNETRDGGHVQNVEKGRRQILREI
jgi:hypothetical protein